MLAYFEIKKNAGGKYFFSFKRGDGRVILVSQSFADRLSMELCIRYLQTSVPEIKTSELSNDKTPFILIHHDKDGDYNFTMKGENNVIVLKSEGYKDYEQCKEGINFFLEHSKTASIVENT